MHTHILLSNSVHTEDKRDASFTKSEHNRNGGSPPHTKTYTKIAHDLHKTLKKIIIPSGPLCWGGLYNIIIAYKFLQNVMGSKMGVSLSLILHISARSISHSNSSKIKNTITDRNKHTFSLDRKMTTLKDLSLKKGHNSTAAYWSTMSPCLAFLSLTHTHT